MADLLLFPAPESPPSPAPVEAAAQVPDAQERERALDIQRSFLVEAPAGSGKTGLLIQRFLKLLATVDDPAQVLAITFTRKATSELTDRVLSRLTEAAAAEVPANPFDRATRPLAEAVLARDAQLGWNLLDQPRRLNIRTIDSVCAGVAASLPILSGSGGGQSASDDASSLYAEAARRTLALLGGPDPALNHALRTILLHRDGNLANCEALLASMLGARDQWGELVPLATAHLDDATLDREVLPRLEKALDLAICRGLTRLNKFLPTSMLHSLCALAAEMGHAEGYNGGSSPLALCAGKFTPPEEKAAHLDHWLALIDLLLTKEGEFRKARGINSRNIKFLIEKKHKQELADLIEQVQHDDTLCELLCSIRDLPPAQYPPDQWRVAKALFQVLSRALAELQQVFALHNRCDFPEIALLAKTALCADSAEADLAAAGPALQHLLVDEMQDTSSTQYELIQSLTRGWDGTSRTVFLVGDPKQSIYLFRQARVERFVQTMHRGRLGELPLTALHLTANFRSQANLVHAFNRDFARIFPSATEPAAVPYRAADATRKASSAASVVWHLNPQPAAASASERAQQATQDAEEIREIVELWRTHHGPAVRIAVLVQSRTHLLPIVQAFKQPGISGPIPYRAIQIEPLRERQEILDLVALTRALLHPADRAAWFALLRTPLCGLTLVDLHQLAGADSHAFAQHTLLELLRERGDLLSPDGIARLEPFWRILEAALRQRGRLPLSQLVLRTWRAFGADRFLDPDATLNVHQYLNLLDELETATGILFLPTLEQRLGKLYAAPSSQPDAVDLMTIHNAKGLEWDLVLVPSLERSGRSNENRLLDWIETDGDNELTDANVAHGILAPIRSKGGDSGRLNQWIQSISKAREAAERKRLFYVACTRAREQVHLFAAPQTKVDGALSAGSRNLLAAAWPAAQLHVPQAAEILPMPRPRAPQILDTLAAVASQGRTIDRIPASLMALPEPQPSTPSVSEPPFARPEGSFRARVLGNTLHAFLERAASRIAADTSFAALLAELPSWSARVAAVLRANGLAGRDVEALIPQVLRGLELSLASDEGRWLLSPHPQAASERSLSTWDDVDQTQTNLRLDRTFLAGPAPLEPGQSYRWIIDYKTSTHALAGLDAWLEQQRALYREQLETYAQALAPSPHPIRLGLYFPLLSRLIWWPA